MAMVELGYQPEINETCKTTEKSKSSLPISTRKRSAMEADYSGSSICDANKEELLKSAKAKMGEVREENERLKKLLAQVVVDYKSLEKRISSMARSTEISDLKNDQIKDEDTEMISLSLGSWNSNKQYDDDTKKESSDTWNKRRKVDEGLDLGLDCKFEHYPSVSASDSMKNSGLDKGNEETKGDGSVKAKDQNTCPNKEGGDEEILHQPQVKKTRVCIRSRCDTPTMNDGCQWRKYGQKIAKGNPCPRAYYRCTVSPTCPVRKQVQRCHDDMSILITTYEGTHNHPLPLAATAMASATSAAASMLKTGSLTSQQTLAVPTNNHLTSTSFGLQTSNLNTPFNIANPRLSIPNPALISASSHSHPTVTLDLTAPNPSLAPFTNWLSSSFSSSSSSTSSRHIPSNFLNFSSSHPSSTSFDFTTTNALPKSTSWPSGYFNYGTLFPSNSSNNNNTNNNNTRIVYPNPSSSQQSLNEALAAVATKAIASNPNLQSVLAAAISSYVGKNKAGNNPNTSSMSPSSSSQTEGNGSLMLFPTSLPLSSTKNSGFAAAAGTRDHST